MIDCGLCNNSICYVFMVKATDSLSLWVLVLVLLMYA